jgi:hypothetical protein
MQVAADTRPGAAKRQDNPIARLRAGVRAWGVWAAAYGGEVAVVEGGELGLAEHLGRRDHGGVDEAQSEVVVTLDEFAAAHAASAQGVEQLQAPVPKSLRSAVKACGQGRRRYSASTSTQTGTTRGSRVSRRRVAQRSWSGIGRVKQRDERPGIDDQRHASGTSRSGWGRAEIRSCGRCAAGQGCLVNVAAPGAESGR